MSDYRFKHWDTTPVKVHRAYISQSYTTDEWRLRQYFERRGDEVWEHSSYEHDLSRLEV